MGFWLATLNPGTKTRRGRRTRRTLTAWQRAVKKHGGVMQAVKARRAGKRKRRGGRRRRNPFLTTVGAGGAKVLMNATRKRKRRRSKIRTRRSAVSRRSLRGRSRRASSSRRSKMARKTRRRRLSRGRGGRFVSRRSRGSRRRGRRTRRNPVLPISWNPKRKRRRGGRRRRNPLFLSRKGFSSRKHRGYRRLRIRRHAPRHWHNNPRRRRSSRRYRNNPVLPISWNPARMLGLGGAPGQIIGKLGSFVDVKFWTETGIPAASGFFGSKAVGGLILDTATRFGLPIPAAAQPYAKMAADALGGATLAYLVSRFYSSKAGDSVWLGTIVNVAHALLKQVLGGTDIARKIGLDGLGDDLAQRMKDEIARRVQGNLQGMGSYLRTTNVPQRGPMGEYVTDRALRMRGGYAPSPAADLKDYDVTNQESAF